MRNCVQVFLLDWRTDKANDNFKKIKRMKKFITLMILSALCLGAKAQLEGVYQIPNSDFETWAKEKEPGNGWNSFNSARTSDLSAFIASTAKSSAPAPSQFTPSYDGSCAVKIFSKSVLNKNANGNLTTGIINMGSTTPSNAANYNFTKRDDSSHSLKFAGMPDAAECYAKFTSGGSPHGRLQFIIHGDVNYTDPEASYSKQGLGSDYAKYKVASAAIIITPCTEWTKFTADFTYTENDETPKVHYMLASATTNPTPGGSANDYLYLDDVKLIYYHSLSSCTYDGQQVTFDGNDSASVSALYDEIKLAYVKKGVGAIVEKAYDNATGVLTITVKGNDYAADNNSVTRYTIQFKKPSDVVSEKSYTETLYVTINGETTEPQEANVLVQTRYDGKFNFVLKNFVLGGEMPVGNINVPSLTKNPDGSFSFQEKTIIQAGDLEGVDENEWLGPLLGELPLDLKGQFVGEDHLRVSIDIDMTTSDLGQFISVHLGYDAASLAVKSAAKYGTFCAPFDVTIPEGVTAYTIGGIDKNGILTLEQQNTISAHTPVIVYSESTTDINAVQFGVATSSTATSKYLTGVYTDTKAPLGSYVLQNQNGRVGFYHVEGTQPWVRANRAYLTVPASANVKAFYMDDATAIQTVEELLSGKAEIYDLAGRRQQKLQKGINIVGGKKVLVK